MVRIVIMTNMLRIAFGYTNLFPSEHLRTKTAVKLVVLTSYFFKKDLAVLIFVGHSVR